MTRHARKPAILTLVFALVAAAILLVSTGQFHASNGVPRSLDQLERAIASGSVDAATWQAYGDALSADAVIAQDYGDTLLKNQRFAHAAAAYQRALDLEPDRPVARFHAALAFAQANDPDKFFAFFERLTATDPKQAAGLVERPELSALHSDPRWDTAATSARAQAAD